MLMDKSRADAIAQAILEPDLKAQAERNRKRAVEAVKLNMQRRLACSGLAGFTIGAAVGHYAFDGISPYGLIGLCAATMICRFLPYRAAVK